MPRNTYFRPVICVYILTPRYIIYLFQSKIKLIDIENQEVKQKYILDNSIEYCSYNFHHKFIYIKYSA